MKEKPIPLSDTAIAVDEWIAELERLQEQPEYGDGLTCPEIAAQTGRSLDKVRLLVRRGLQAGTVERVPVIRETIVGHTRPFIGFRTTS